MNPLVVSAAKSGRRHHQRRRLLSLSPQKASAVNQRIVRELDRPRFYRVGEAAAILNLSPMTLYRAIQAGEFPAIRVRNRIIVPARAIDDIEQAAVTSNRVVDTADFTTTTLPARPQA
ncbi:helix-turn-helix domain-containing protein [Amycolatopsis sp. cmx-4-83]|uniref:helix-turn-helix domain-containing protein n=1 Tax=Amycolatopsis sp. cmx-4-83 TaxID=2790940 RepID=UPI00397D8225